MSQSDAEQRPNPVVVLPNQAAQDVEAEQPPNPAPGEGPQQNAETQLPVVEELGDQIKALKAELDNLKAQSNTVSVEASLARVRQLASSPVRFRDPSAIVAALQKLADDARTTNHEKAAEYEAVLRQSRALMFNPQFGDIITRLVGSKEESRVANTIAKMVKNSTPRLSVQPYPRPLMKSRGAGSQRNRGTCFKCGQVGHFQRNCPNR